MFPFTSKSFMTTAARGRRRRRSSGGQRKQQLWLIGGGVLIVGMVLAVVFLNIRRSLPVGSEQTLPTLGNVHIPEGSASPITYNSTPPTSGPHYPSVVNWGVSPTPQRYEHLVHNLEDGGVVIYYQCPEGCPEMVEQLRATVGTQASAGRHLVLVPNDPTWTAGGPTPVHQDMESRIALTAWQRIDKFDEFDAERIQAFIDHYEGIDHHQ